MKALITLGDESLPISPFRINKITKSETFGRLKRDRNGGKLYHTMLSARISKLPWYKQFYLFNKYNFATYHRPSIEIDRSSWRWDITTIEFKCVPDRDASYVELVKVWDDGLARFHGGNI